MAIGSPVVYADFSGGINKQAGPYLLQENQCQDARNITASPQGGLQKRKGFGSFSTIKNDSDVSQLDGAAHSLAAVNPSSGIHLIAAGKTPSASTDSLVAIDSGGEATAIKTGLEQGKRWEFVQMPTQDSEGPVFGINGEDTPQFWSGTGNTGDWTAVNDADSALTPHPAEKCQFMIYHLDRIWASGDPANPGRVFASGVNSNGLPTPRNWDALNHDYVDPADGEQITGLGKVGPYLAVFKNRKTYVLSDPVSRSYRAISSTIGCVSHRSIVETSIGTFFLSEDLGVCVTDGTGVSVMSDAIEPFIKQICADQPTAIKNAAATYHDDSYYLSLPVDSGTNTITLEFNITTRSWWIHTCASNQFALLDPTGSPKLYSAFPSAQRIEEAFAENTWADNGVPYESYWTGPFWAWGQPHLNKRINQYRIDGLGEWRTETASTFQGAYETLGYGILWESAAAAGGDFGGAGKFGDVDEENDPPLTNSIFGPQGGVSQRRYPTPHRGWGRAWSLRITDQGAVNNMEIFSVAAFTRPRTD